MNATFERHLRQIWSGRGLWAWLLWPLSCLLRGLTALRRLGYRHGWLASGHAGLPTLVIGNVIAGGAGKTPTAIAVLRHLQAQGWRPGLVSRGHGRRVMPGEADVRAVDADSTPEAVGDEPLLIHRATGVPVAVGRRRLEAARALRAAHPEIDILVCDDGLQHLALQRDLEIWVFDERGAGNGWLLPAGPLREPWPRPVDLCLHTGPNPLPRGANDFAATRALSGQVIRADGQRLPMDALRGKSLQAVAGIARPEAFFAMLRDAGLTLAATCALPDHHDFAGWQPPQADLPVLCTEKDAVKLWQQHPQAWAVALVLTPEAGFWTALDARLAGWAKARLSSRDGYQTA